MIEKDRLVTAAEAAAVAVAVAAKIRLTHLVDCCKK